MRHFDPDHPIVLGLAGRAGTGKTSTADRLAPQASTRFAHEDERVRVIWSHLFFALPLYELAAIRQGIEGVKARDRMRYQIHAALINVFGASPLYGAPPYEKLVDMVEEIATYPCQRDGKPRQFLQHVGTDIMRAHDENVWVKWMDRKIREEYLRFYEEYLRPFEEDDHNLDGLPPLYAVVISDVRFPNEAEFIKAQPNGLLFRLTASDETIAKRQIERDGTEIDPEHKQHSSETSVDLIDHSLYDRVIETDNITLDEQVALIRLAVKEFTGVSLNA